MSIHQQKGSLFNMSQRKNITTCTGKTTATAGILQVPPPLESGIGSSKLKKKHRFFGKKKGWKESQRPTITYLYQFFEGKKHIYIYIIEIKWISKMCGTHSSIHQGFMKQKELLIDFPCSTCSWAPWVGLEFVVLNEQPNPWLLTGSGEGSWQIRENMAKTVVEVNERCK